MAKFREILRLHAMGHSQCAIAQSCAVARSTVQDYVRRATAKNLSYEQLRQLSDDAVKELLGKGKRKATQPVVARQLDRPNDDYIDHPRNCSF